MVIIEHGLVLDLALGKFNKMYNYTIEQGMLTHTILNDESQKGMGQSKEKR